MNNKYGVPRLHLANPSFEDSVTVHRSIDFWLKSATNQDEQYGTLMRARHVLRGLIFPICDESATAINRTILTKEWNELFSDKGDVVVDAVVLLANQDTARLESDPDLSHYSLFVAGARYLINNPPKKRLFRRA